MLKEEMGVSVQKTLRMWTLQPFELLAFSRVSLHSCLTAASAYSGLEGIAKVVTGTSLRSWPTSSDGCLTEKSTASPRSLTKREATRPWSKERSGQGEASKEVTMV